MSYSRKKCRTTFTADQIARMEYYYYNYRQAQLSNPPPAVLTNSCPPGEDADYDGVCDNNDVCTNRVDTDSDGNNIADACENCPVIDFEAADVEDYSQDGEDGSLLTWYNPAIAHIDENGWKAIPINYTITISTRTKVCFVW